MNVGLAAGAIRRFTIQVAVLRIVGLMVAPANAEDVVYADFGDTTHTDMGKIGVLGELYPVNTNDAIYLNAGTVGGAWTTVRSTSCIGARTRLPRKRARDRS